MRKFSGTEKDVIKKLIGAENALFYSVSAVFEDITNGIEIDTNGYVRADKIETNVLSKQIQITHATLLLQWLAENRYIWITSYGLPELELKKEISFKYGTPFPIPPEVFKLYKQYYSCAVFVSPELVELVKNEFKTYEDFALDEAKKQTENARKESRKSWFAIIVSIITLLASLYMVYLTRKC